MTQRPPINAASPEVQRFPIPIPPVIENTAISCSACHSPGSPTAPLMWCHFCAQSTCKQCFLPQKREIVVGYPVPICVRCSVLVKAKQINQPQPLGTDALAEHQTKLQNAEAP